MTEDKGAQFARKMTDILNYGALNLAMGIGYKAGLFDAMAQIETPAAAREISARAGLSDRYVSEWLSVMATGGIIEIQPQESDEPLFFLPPEHALFLTRSSADSNLGVYTQEIPLLTQCALTPVMEGFKTGNGIGYSAYPDFQAFMGELADAKHEKVLVDHFLPLVDGGNIVKRLAKGIRVCDLGCGQGVALQLMADAFPASEFVGIDNHEPAILAAKAEAQRRGLENIRFDCMDAARIEGRKAFESQFDYITAFDAIHDQSHPLAALTSVAYMLADKGIFSMVDIDAQSDVASNMEHPMGPFLYTVSLMHCMPVGLAEDGAGLGMMWGRRKAVDLLEKAGFSQVEVCEMAHDPFNVHYQCRRSAP